MKTDQTFLNNLFTIERIEIASVNKLTAEIAINPQHPIFKGHFPGNPVLPGAATIQILKELISEHLGKKVNLVKAGTIKFLSFINPQKNNLIDFDIALNETEEGTMGCNAKIYYKEIAFCNFKGEFSKG